jgi:Tol biopolymer transport system component
VTRVTATPDYEVAPEFSPDGESIVYAAGRPGDRADHIFLRSVDGKVVRQLTREDANDASPAFSPDGSLIVFTRDKTYNFGGLASNWDAGGVLCVIKPDGTGLWQITEDGSVAVDPCFSPDGRTILFLGQGGLSTVAADGTATPASLGVPDGMEASYSPDGRVISFSGGRYAPDSRIFAARADGTGRRRLAGPVRADEPPPSGGCFRPRFMPDGRRVLFFAESWPDGPTGVSKKSIWEIGLDGAGLRQIAGGDLFDDPLAWRSGRQIPATKP